MLRGLLAFALIASTGLAAQDRFIPRDNSASQTGTSVIRGRIVSAANGEPLRKARVSLSSRAGPVFTDNEGRFAFTNLPAARYTLSVRKAGYAATTFGAIRASSPPISIEVAAGATVGGIEVRVPKGAAISGRITDQFGDPVELAIVSAMRIVPSGGRTATVPQATNLTDDLGEYRLGGLPAGSYLVSAAMPNLRNGMIMNGLRNGMIMNGVAMMASDIQPSAPTYYPGVPGLSQAQSLNVHAGDEAPSIDFAVSPVTLAKVSLAIVDANGKPTDAVATFSMVGSSLNGPRSGPVHTPAAVAALEPGEWVVQARGDRGGAGTARFFVGTDDAVVTVTLGPGGSIAGSIVVEGAPLPPGTLLQVDAVPLDLSMTAGFSRTNRDGTFEILGLLGARDLQVRGAPAGWPLKAIMFESRNLIDTPIDFKDGQDLTGVQLVLTSRVATLKGTALDLAKVPVKNFSVLLFPEDSGAPGHSASRTRAVRPNQTGEFVAEALLSGGYLVIAVTDIDEARWPMADYVAALRAGATRVTLGEGETKTIALQIGGAP